MSTIGDFFKRLESKLGIKSPANKEFLLRVAKNRPLSGDQNNYSYVQEYAKNALIYTVVNKISFIASQVPFKLYRVRADGEKVEVKDHEILRRWRFPNKYEGGHEFRKKLCDFYLTTGNAYILPYVVDEDNFEVANLNILPAQDIEIIVGDWLDPIKGYTLNYDGSEKEFSADQVVHWKMANMDYQVGQQYYGMSPLKPLSKVLSTSNTAFDVKIKDFKAGGVKGFISLKNEEASLDEEQAQALIDKVLSNRLALINDDAQFEEVGLSIADMDVVNSIKKDFDLICSAYGVNPGLFEGDTTFENQRMYMRSLYTQVIMPMLYSLYDRINAMWVTKVQSNLLLLPDFENVKELEEDLLMRAVQVNQAEWLTINEKREATGKPRLDDDLFDKPFFELGKTPADDFKLPPDQRNPMGTTSRQSVNETRQTRVEQQDGSEDADSQKVRKELKQLKEDVEEIKRKKSKRKLFE